MSKRFRHEDVASVPSGWKVRTVTAGSHRVRVAFPPGRKQVGSGRLVSVLHPLSGSNPCMNPCSLRSANPQELMVMSANNPPRGRRNPSVYRVVLIPKNGSPSWVTKEFDTRSEASDYKKTVDKKAFRILVRKVHRDNSGRNPAELMVMAANPRVEVVHGDNPPVEEIAEEFSGVDVKYIDVYNEPHIPRGRYAYLAKLYRLLIKPEKGGQVQRVTFNQTDPPLIVSDSTGKQIYFVGGAQDLTECLATFTDTTNARVSDHGIVLGEAREIHYIGKKHHIGDEDTDEWRHKHGEEDGLLPTVVFDAQAKRLLYEGGNYRIEGPWMHN